MAEWKTPVFDRTMDDVKSVDRTSADYQKGTLNADDLNRIEGNFAYLEEKLRGDAIFIPHVFRNYEETVLEYVENSDVLPEECKRVAYIESTGTQYIDTGFKPNQDTRVIADVELKLNGNNYFLFGARKSVSGNTAATFGFNAYKDNFYRTHYYNGYSDFASTVVFDTRFTVDANKNVTTLNGEYTVTRAYNMFTAPCTMSIFAMNTDGTNGTYGTGKVYMFQIYDNDVLVRDYIPVIDENGEACLYDQLNHVYYHNAGTGAFTAGAELPKETTKEVIEVKRTYTDWQEQNLPWLSEINRIRANYNALVRLFLVGLGLPVLAESNYLDYVEVNDWEHIALVGKTMFENMEKEYRYCGIEESGGDRLL